MEGVVMGFNLGPFHIGDVRCPECQKVMIAVMGQRVCPLAHCIATTQSKFKPVKLKNKQERLDALNQLVQAGYISQRNYKYAMQQILGKKNPAVKELAGEAVEPSSKFKLFADSDQQSDVAALAGSMKRLFTKKKIETKEDPPKAAIEEKKDSDPE
jgi:hypothetical protein